MPGTFVAARTPCRTPLCETPGTFTARDGSLRVAADFRGPMPPEGRVPAQAFPGQDPPRAYAVSAGEIWLTLPLLVASVGWFVVGLGVGLVVATGGGLRVRRR